MTKEQAIEELEILKEDYWDDDGYGHETEQYKDTMFALDMAINALENQCPSKGADCEDCPANEPKAKVGKWIPTYGNVKCSVCGNVKDSRNVGKATHYCDFCGAKMESEDKE